MRNKSTSRRNKTLEFGVGLFIVLHYLFEHVAWLPHGRSWLTRTCIKRSDYALGLSLSEGVKTIPPATSI